MDKTPKFRPPLVGGSSLLVIFAVLCLVVLVFTLLIKALFMGFSSGIILFLCMIRTPQYQRTERRSVPGNSHIKQRLWCSRGHAVPVAIHSAFLVILATQAAGRESLHTDLNIAHPGPPPFSAALLSTWRYRL